MNLRKEYEVRLEQYKLRYEKEHLQLQDIIAMQDKQFENQTSKVSLTHIQHNSTLEDQALNRKQLEMEKRELEKQIDYKNKEIEALNKNNLLLEGYGKKEMDKYADEVKKLKEQHARYVADSDRQNQDWNREREEYKERIHGLDVKLQEADDDKRESMEKLQKEIEKHRLKIAAQEGEIEELHGKCGVLDTKHKVEASNVEKTQIESQSLMNNERTKFLETRDKENRLQNE